MPPRYRQIIAGTTRIVPPWTGVGTSSPIGSRDRASRAGKRGARSRAVPPPESKSAREEETSCIRPTGPAQQGAYFALGDSDPNTGPIGTLVVFPSKLDGVRSILGRVRRHRALRWTGRAAVSAGWRRGGRSSAPVAFCACRIGGTERLYPMDTPGHGMGIGTETITRQREDTRVCPVGVVQRWMRTVSATVPAALVAIQSG